MNARAAAGRGRRPARPVSLGPRVVTVFGLEPFEILGRAPVRLLDVLLEFRSLDPPPVAAADLNALQLTDPDKGICR
jgi:hypothetical protein